ncbi:SURF1 family protein [Pontibacter sp. JAM-7]|uniref:SURF1 family protein n=1 Tax=Pontibacter sp. JAM-7 TaxID=3366581 RepID=UPI003AF45D51
MNLQSKDQSTLRFKWMLGSFAVIGLPVLIGLGCWQLQRATEKQQLIDSMQQAEPMAFLPPLQTLSSGQYQPVRLTGLLDPQRYFLLDNRTRDGKVGYEIIGVFQPRQEALLVLVNLGWLVAPVSRDNLPQVVLPREEVEISMLVKATDKQLLLAEDHWSEGWPKRIQTLDFNLVQRFVSQPLWQAEARAQAPVVSELDIRWNLNLVPPERHLGYAVQWFALALALLVLLVVSWFRMQREDIDE